ncbi:MAG: hypothetical protein ACLFR0_09145 [Alphaproteobacteria bacterium]
MTFKHILIFTLATCILSSVLGAQKAALAQEEEDLRPAILRVNYNDLESFGLYTNPREGSLGRDLWDNSRRSLITGLLPKLPLPGKSPSQQKMLMGALLTAANARLIEDDIDIEPGKDVLTLRLEKLNAMGAYKQSFQIYSALGSEPYHINLAKAGTTALLFNGERSLACLEYKTMEDRAFESEFWNEITRYCRYVLAGENKEDVKNAQSGLKESKLPTLRSIAANKDYSINHGTNSFKKISELEKAILVAENRVNWPDISTAFLQKLPLNQLGIFLARPDLEPTEEFLIKVQAAKRGLIHPHMLGEFYDDIYENELRQAESADGLGWKKIAYAYHHLQKERADSDKWQHILSVYPFIDTYGPIVLSPFAAHMQTINIEGQSDSIIENALRIINYAGENIPGQWIKHFESRENSSKFDLSLYFLAQIWQEESSDDMLEDPKIQAFLQDRGKKLQLNYYNIIENLDKRFENIHNADEIYGNELDLTFTENYVMPMPRVWDRFVNSSQNKRIGETVLLSTVMLRKQSLGYHYPGVARDVLLSFNNVGLTKTSKNLVLELVLEQL